MIENWVVLPVSAFFGILSMMFGIGVSPMFLPFLVLVQGLPFGAAVAATLMIEIFGFSAALVSFIRKHCIAYRLGAQILLHTIPASIIGVIISSSISPTVSMILFALILLTIGVLIIHPEAEILYRRDDPAAGFVVSEFGIARNISLVASTLSGLFAGMTSTGMGEINNYVFLKKFRMPGEVATATSMFVIAITALFIALGHAADLFLHHREVLISLGSTIIWGAIGILIGVIVGTNANFNISDGKRERYVASIFFALGILALVTLFV